MDIMFQSAPEPFEKRKMDCNAADIFNEDSQSTRGSTMQSPAACATKTSGKR
jgi:hypothetical protein